ncbi:hypothetical protein LZ32DRAFT_109168 [Colletotrichum eremochloae]|nr:hypothetical protein LZ32DRAFT_109168 [Colletotrichum eremochloae]
MCVCVCALPLRTSSTLLSAIPTHGNLSRHGVGLGLQETRTHGTDRQTQHHLPRQVVSLSCSQMTSLPHPALKGGLSNSWYFDDSYHTRHQHGPGQSAIPQPVHKAASLLLFPLSSSASIQRYTNRHYYVGSTPACARDGHIRTASWPLPDPCALLHSEKETCLVRPDKSAPRSFRCGWILTGRIQFLVSGSSPACRVMKV